MSDVKFRATVKHDGAEVGDLPWLEEFWAVRYGDYSALQDRIEELEDKLDWVLVERDETFALMLDRAQTAEARVEKLAGAGKEAFETFMLTGGGSPTAWANHVKAMQELKAVMAELGEGIAEDAETDTSKALWDYPEALRSAADRIEELETKLAECEARLGKANAELWRLWRTGNA